MFSVSGNCKLKSFTVELFGRVYTGVSAIMYVDANDHPVCYTQFDTYAGFPRSLPPVPKGCRVALVSNHPEGCDGLNDEDNANLSNAYRLLQMPIYIYLLVDKKFTYCGVCKVDAQASDHKPGQVQHAFRVVR